MKMGCCGVDCCVPPKESREPLQYDPTFNGPIHRRSCTDVIWLILFILFLGVWVFVGYHGMTHGNIQNLLAPMDSDGKRCGLDSALQDKKYLVFFNIADCLSPDTPIVGCPTKQVCVEKCPEKTIDFESPEINDKSFLEVRSSMVCSYNIDVKTLSHDQALKKINNKECAKTVLKSEPVMGRCFPNVMEWLNIANSTMPNLTESDILDKVTELVQLQELSAHIVQDLVQSRWYLLGGLIAVVVVCFIYILLLRWVVAPVVWASIAGLIGVLGFALYLSYEQYIYFKANPVQLIKTTNAKGFLQSLFVKPQTWLAILIALAVIVLILLIMVIFLRSRITLAIALIKEGSKAVYAVKSTVFFPIFPWILQCGVIAFGVVVFVYLVSIGEPAFTVINLKADTDCQCQHYSEDYVSCNLALFNATCSRKGGGPCSIASCHFTGLDSPTSVVWLHLANLLGFFWTMFFISGVADMMLASTFSTWYWTFKKKNLPFFTLTSSILRTVRYHLGTVALGALIIAIVRVIRVILEYIDHKIKKFDNPLTRCIMCFCKCFCWCLENFLKFVNKNAYIMCAVHGKSFCSSARDAFSLLMRNIVRVVVLDKVTDFIFFLSKMLISIGVGFAVYYLLEWKFVYEVTQGEKLHYNFVPAIILSIATYLVSTIFFNVYAMAVDTLFLCFLEDCERNDGSPEKPYFMSKNLMKILGKKNKIE